MGRDTDPSIPVLTEREWQLEQAVEDYRVRLREVARERDAARAEAAEARRERDALRREVADLREAIARIAA